MNFSDATHLCRLEQKWNRSFFEPISVRPIGLRLVFDYAVYAFYARACGGVVTAFNAKAMRKARTANPGALRAI
jgi:hypothetical protein